jgi:HSP20 family molecular chaperone IbpA
MPRVDLCEHLSSDGSSSQVTAVFELPGLRKSELTLEVKDGWLIVEGERRKPVYQRARTLRLRRSPSATTPPPEPRASSPRSLAHLLNLDEPVMAISESGIHEPRMQTDSSDITIPDGYTTVEPISEIRYGRFRRTIKLPRGIEAHDVDASMADGLLTVSWPSVSALGDIATRVSVK